MFGQAASVRFYSVLFCSVYMMMMMMMMCMWCVLCGIREPLVHEFTFLHNKCGRVFILSSKKRPFLSITRVKSIRLLIEN